MKKISLKKDLFIPGWGALQEGERFDVVRFNSRFVYVRLGDCELRLARKSECNIIY